mgnify:CR=1 FL=1
MKLLPPVRKTNCNVPNGGTLAHSEILAGFDRNDDTVNPEQHQLEAPPIVTNRATCLEPGR